MASGHGFLSPRDLLVNDNFCLKLASFRKLSSVILETENLPSSDDALRQKVGFWESGYQILYEYLRPIVDEFQTVKEVAANLNWAFRYTDTVCDNALTLCTNAPEDYDKIFKGIDAVRQDPDNDTLRRQVQKDIQARKDGVQFLLDVSNNWSSLLGSYVSRAQDCQTEVQNLALPFQGTTLRDRLTRDDNPQDLEDDLEALENVPGVLEGFSMVEDMNDSLQEVQKMAGGANLIAADIESLVDYINKHLDPNENPLHGLVERKLLEKWDTLKQHITEFKDAYKNS